MFRTIKIASMLGLAAFAAACTTARQDEVVFVEPEPVAVI